MVPLLKSLPTYSVVAIGIVCALAVYGLLCLLTPGWRWLNNRAKSLFRAAILEDDALVYRAERSVSLREVLSLKASLRFSELCADDAAKLGLLPEYERCATIVVSNIGNSTITGVDVILQSITQIGGKKESDNEERIERIIRSKLAGMAESRNYSELTTASPDVAVFFVGQRSDLPGFRFRTTGRPLKYETHDSLAISDTWISPAIYHVHAKVVGDLVAPVELRFRLSTQNNKLTVQEN